MTAIPEHIMEQARALNMKLHSATELGQRTEWLASALLSAEKRGREEEREASWKHGFLIGFGSSGEGWNGEYPFRDGDVSPASDEQWVERRDLAFASIRSGS